jgi:hypothetical protein
MIDRIRYSPPALVLCYSLELGSTIRLVNARHGESGAPP